VGLAVRSPKGQPPGPRALAVHAVVASSDGFRACATYPLDRPTTALIRTPRERVEPQPLIRSHGAERCANRLLRRSGPSGASRVIALTSHRHQMRMASSAFQHLARDLVWDHGSEVYESFGSEGPRGRGPACDCERDRSIGVSLSGLNNRFRLRPRVRTRSGEPGQSTPGTPGRPRSAPSAELPHVLMLPTSSEATGSEGSGAIRRAAPSPSC